MTKSFCLCYLSIHAPPHGERRSQIATKSLLSISIHAPPHGERLIHPMPQDAHPHISIHAPPHGERQWSLPSLPVRGHFNPRSPARGATGVNSEKFSELQISIHAPPHGERLTDNPYCDLTDGISIHAPPHGERLSPEPIPASAPLFQSTLPRTGSDADAIFIIGIFYYFNPRSPARGATIRHIPSPPH